MAPAICVSGSQIGMPPAHTAADNLAPQAIGRTATTGICFQMTPTKQTIRNNLRRSRPLGERKWNRSVTVECFGDSCTEPDEASSSGRSHNLESLLPVGRLDSEVLARRIDGGGPYDRQSLYEAADESTDFVGGPYLSGLLPEDSQVGSVGGLKRGNSVDGATGGIGRPSTGDAGKAATSRLSTQVGTWLLHLVAVGYAAAAVAQKCLEGGADLAGPAPPTSLHFFLRFSMAAAAVGGPLLFRNWFRTTASSPPGGTPPDSSPAGSRTSVFRGMELGGWMFLTYAGQAVGLESSSADHATLLLTLSVVLVPFLEAIGGRAISRNVWTATALASVGIVLLEGGGATLAGGVGGGWGMLQLPPGHLWCLAGAVCSAIHVVRSEAFCAENEPLTLTAVQLATAGALAVPWIASDLAHAGPTLGNFPGALESIPWGLLMLAGPLGTGLCELLELEALRFVKASTATLILTAGPLWTTVFAFMFLGEGLDNSSLAGAALLLVATLQAQKLPAENVKEGGGGGSGLGSGVEVGREGVGIAEVNEGEEQRMNECNGDFGTQNTRNRTNGFGIARHAKRRAMSLVWAKVRGCAEKRGE